MPILRRLVQDHICMSARCVNQVQSLDIWLWHLSDVDLHVLLRVFLDICGRGRQVQEIDIWIVNSIQQLSMSVAWLSVIVCVMLLLLCIVQIFERIVWCFELNWNHTTPSELIISKCDHNHNYKCLLQFCVLVQVVLPYLVVQDACTTQIRQRLTSVGLAGPHIRYIRCAAPARTVLQQGKSENSSY